MIKLFCTGVFRQRVFCPVLLTTCSKTERRWRDRRGPWSPFLWQQSPELSLQNHSCPFSESTLDAQVDSDPIVRATVIKTIRTICAPSNPLPIFLRTVKAETGDSLPFLPVEAAMPRTLSATTGGVFRRSPTRLSSKGKGFDLSVASLDGLLYIAGAATLTKDEAKTHDAGVLKTEKFLTRIMFSSVRAFDDQQRQLVRLLPEPLYPPAIADAMASWFDDTDLSFRELLQRALTVILADKEGMVPIHLRPLVSDILPKPILDLASRDLKSMKDADLAELIQDLRDVHGDARLDGGSWRLIKDVIGDSEHLGTRFTAYRLRRAAIPFLLTANIALLKNRAPRAFENFRDALKSEAQVNEIARVYGQIEKYVVSRAGVSLLMRDFKDAEMDFKYINMLLYQSEYNHASAIRELGVDRTLFDYAVPIVLKRGQGGKDVVTQLRFTTRNGPKPVTMEEFDEWMENVTARSKKSELPSIALMISQRGASEYWNTREEHPFSFTLEKRGKTYFVLIREAKPSDLLPGLTNGGVIWRKHGDAAQGTQEEGEENPTLI